MLAANRPVVAIFSTQTDDFRFALSASSGKNLGLSRVTILLFTSHGEFLALSKETSQLSKLCDR